MNAATLRFHPAVVLLASTIWACNSTDTVPPVNGTGATDSGASGTTMDAAQTRDATLVDTGSNADATAADSGASDTGQGAKDATPADAGGNDRFSFFVTSLAAMRRLSGSQDGFGGDLGGLAGADGICQNIATSVGVGNKTWRAFLSVTNDGAGNVVNAIDRIGAGPWYDANGRLVANSVQGLMGDRPDGDAQTVADLPDEFGVPLSQLGDSHDIMTGTNRQGRLNENSLAATCNDWTDSGPGTPMRIMCGHSWPRAGNRGKNWMSDHPIRGCSPGVNLTQNGPGMGTCVGCSGGYGGIYCFATTP